MEYKDVNKKRKPIKRKKPTKKRTVKNNAVENDVNRSPAVKEVSEKPIKKPKKYKSLKRIKRRRKIFAVTSIVLVLSITFVALSLTVLFPIKTIKVTGNEIYSADDIISNSGVIKGDNLVLANESRGKTSICSARPYVESVEFERSFPFTLNIKVKESDVFAQIKLGSQYLRINSNGKCLEIADKFQSGSPMVTGLTASNSEISSTAAFKQDEFENDILNELNELIQTFNENGLDEITVINLSNRQDIRVTYKNKIVLLFGSNSNMDKKINHAIATLKARQDVDETGTLNLSRIPSTKNEASFIPRDLEDDEIAKSKK